MTEQDIYLGDILIYIQDKMMIEDMPEMWKDSIFVKQRFLQIDKRGSVGERFFAQTLFKLYPRRIEYNDGNQGDWDLKINKIKFEIKTASLDKNGKFQNEGLKINGDYDAVLFLGIAPNNLYIKFIKVKDIDFSKLHNRGNDGTNKNATGAGFKLDFKESDMIHVITLEDIKVEFEKVFPEIK